MTQKTLEWQTRRFLDLETHREGITVFIRPIVVAEIALDGVQVSKRYPGGVAQLRTVEALPGRQVTGRR